MILGGMGAGLTQAPLFAAASALAPHRTTTGSAVLNMARQVGSAVGVALLVVLLAGRHPGVLALFHRGWILVLVAAGGAGLSLVLTRTGAAAHAGAQLGRPTPPSGSRSIRSGGAASSSVTSASRARPASVWSCLQRGVDRRLALPQLGHPYRVRLGGRAVDQVQLTSRRLAERLGDVEQQLGQARRPCRAARSS